MKTTQASVIIGALLPISCNALVGIDWKLTGGGSKGLPDITFPISMPDAPHERGGIGYTGLQPRSDENGQPQVHVAFSSFVKGSTSTDANCHDGADGGAGVSCSKTFSGSYDDTYNLEVKNIGNTTWQGTAISSKTGTKTHVGSYTLPDGYEGIKGSQTGFVEYFPWNSQKSHSCSSLPYTSVTFGAPTSSVGKGSEGEPFEYGDCKGMAGFEKQDLAGGAKEIEIGFK